VARCARWVADLGAQQIHRVLLFAAIAGVRPLLQRRLAVLERLRQLATRLAQHRRVVQRGLRFRVVVSLLRLRLARNAACPARAAAAPKIALSASDPRGCSSTNASSARAFAASSGTASDIAYALCSSTRRRSACRLPCTVSRLSPRNRSDHSCTAR